MACALTYSIYLNRGKTIRFGLVFLLPMLLLTALLNPIFNHQGGTILTYLPDGNPLTLESILYGLAAATMLIGMISWFSCFNAVFTSDKFIYLFGRIIPALSLILSMSLRLVPHFRAQLKVISNAQKCIGRDATNGNLLAKAKNGIRILSVMVTWALENAIDTADSMKSRGYGLPGRSAFSIYRIDRRDVTALIFLTACGIHVIAGAAMGAVQFRYFPTIKGVGANVYTVSVFMSYFLLCISPVVINMYERRRLVVAVRRGSFPGSREEGSNENKERRLKER